MGNHLFDALEIILMSIALGLDAFSLAIGIGLKGLKRNQAIVLIILIGFFHSLLTLCGISIGHLMQGMLGRVAKWFGAFLLLGLGLQMLYTTLFKRGDHVSLGTTTLSFLLFAAGVSVDALSVGFSLGLRSTAYGVVSALAFGVMGAFMSGIGLMIGKRAHRLTGIYGELLGALILIGYGLHFIVG